MRRRCRTPNGRSRSIRRPRSGRPARRIAVFESIANVHSASFISFAPWTFSLPDTTTLSADLKPGDQVHVRYMDHDGKATAVAIQVRPATSAAATKPAEKK